MEDDDVEVQVEVVERPQDVEVVWEVKRVLDKRINPETESAEYLLEWNNWDGEPTWEPAHNCSCQALIDRFEREKARRESRLSSQIANGSQILDDTDYEEHQQRMEDRKLKLKEIIGAVNDKQDMLFIVKWQGLSEPEKVPLKVLRRFYAQNILDFFLEKLKWT